MIAATYVLSNLHALFIVFIVYYLAVRQQSARLLDARLFAYLSLAVAAVLVTDSAMWLADGVPGKFAREVNRVSCLLSYLLTPVPIILWSLYSNLKIFGDPSRLGKRTTFFLIFYIFYFCMLVLLQNHYLLYSIGFDNAYRRGLAFYALPILCGSLYVFTLLEIILNRRSMSKENVLPLLAFPVISMIGGLIQTIWYGVSVLGISMTLVLLIIFISIQNKQINTDHLTGLYNRREFGAYYRQVMSKRKKSYITGVLVDIDQFKRINDTYGHMMGDMAIIETARILREGVGWRGMLVRYSGDEFAYLHECDHPKEIKETVRRIRNNLKRLNEKQTLPCEIGLSIGYDSVPKAMNLTFEEFFNRLDRKMYAVKAEKHMAR